MPTNPQRMLPHKLTMEACMSNGMLSTSRGSILACLCGINAGGGSLQLAARMLCQAHQAVAAHQGGPAAPLLALLVEACMRNVHRLQRAIQLVERFQTWCRPCACVSAKRRWTVTPKQATCAQVGQALNMQYPGDVRPASKQACRQARHQNAERQKRTCFARSRASKSAPWAR